ncbi:response regulator transcription factor [Alteromonas sp. 14N.309.X.WAT.G.H12]|uniref:response regulator transcription factor n=1 Tax=Alteromonas sp. 14N.309.X.WAT.G.H12 TaxID=3120824 RepID=UPI002FD28F10
MKVLIVEDNPQVMETLCDYLIMENHIVESAYEGKAALAMLARQHFDVIVMDIMMPKLNGIDTVTTIRQTLKLSTPILFLTAKDTIADKLAAYSAGGDDYLVKPFNMVELMLKLGALSKRGHRTDIAPISVGDFSYHPQTEALYYAGERIQISPIQFQILKKLMLAFPAVVSRDDMTETIWGEEAPDSDALRSHIYSLRTKLKQLAGKDVLKTAHGRGFTLVS